MSSNPSRVRVRLVAVLILGGAAAAGLLLLAFPGSAALPPRQAGPPAETSPATTGPAGNSLAAPAPADPAAAARLRADGDARRQAGDLRAALDLYVRARDADPSDPATHLRIAVSSEALRTREPGLAALDRYVSLVPDKRGDARLRELRTALEALPAGGPATAAAGAVVTPATKAAAADPDALRTALRIRAVKQICQEMAAALTNNDPAAAKAKADEARRQLAPLLIDPAQANPDVWRLAGVLADASADDALAAVAVEGILRTNPDVQADEPLFELVARLSRRVPDERVKATTAARERVARALPAARAGDADAKSALADAYAAGTGVAVNLTEATKWGWSGTLKNSVGMKLAVIRPGTFTMGSPPNEEGRSNYETPHAVTLTRAYYLGITEVTQAQWKAVMGADNDPSHFKGDILPVEQVSWNDAVEFCKRLSEKEGKRYRLPTEAEWEYACRAGTTTPFHTGDTISTDQANYNGTFVYGSGVKGVYRQQTTVVGSFRANAWDIHDMHGNVSEWCSDGPSDYPTGAAIDPKGNDSLRRVVRGGSWAHEAHGCRAAYRGNDAPHYRGSFTGFRVVLDSE